MKINFLNNVSKFFLALMFVFGFISPASVFAATTPSLGAAATYTVLGSTYTNTTAGTTISGDIGFTTGPAVAPSGVHSNYGSGAPYATAGGDQNAALSALSSQSCTFNFGAGAINLSTDTTHGAAGLYTPGVYCSSGAMDVGGPLTLSGSGTFIFRPAGALTSTAGASVSLAGGASACDVFWTPTQATTLGANTTFVGTVIDNSGITIGANTVWGGKALAFGGTVTTDTDTITVPICTAPPVVIVPISPVLVPPLINVLKVPSLLSLSVGSGLIQYDYTVSNIGTVPMSNITVTDNKCFPVSFLSGDTNNNAMLEVNEVWHYRCTATVSQTTTNTVTATGLANGFTAIDTADATVIVGAPVVPPLIHLVKRPNIFLLPVGGGSVVYNYTVTNPGTVALSNVSVVDNRCSTFSLGHSGDVNNNNMLDVTEVWTYTCQSYLTQTTTNTGTAQGSANGLTATDYSIATVVVSTPALPATGFPPQEKSAPWNIIISAGIIGIIMSFYVARKKEVI